MSTPPLTIQVGKTGLTVRQHQQVLGLIEAACVPLSRTFYVDKNAAAGGDGSICLPFNTIQAALNAIGQPVSNAEFNDPTSARYEVVVAPGVYNENLSVPIRQTIAMLLRSAVIVGDMTWGGDTTAIQGTGVAQIPKLSIAHYDPEGGSVANPEIPKNGVDGDIIVQAKVTGPVGSFFHLNLFWMGVTGDIKCLRTMPGGNNYTLQVRGKGLSCEGKLITDPDPDFTQLTLISDESSFGGATGKVNIDVFRNSGFGGPLVVDSPHGSWEDSGIPAGEAHDFTGSAGTIGIDYSTLLDYFEAVFKAPGTPGAEDFFVFGVLAGTTAERLAFTGKITNDGVIFYDTTLNQPTWRSSASATGWKDAAGIDI